MTSGSWAISQPFLNSIIETLPKGSTILEFGSGNGTKRLIDLGYVVYSVEQNIDWVGKYHTNYCHAPIKNGWYDVDIVNEFIKDKKYDALLIDGPAGQANSRLHIFESNVSLETIIFVDDIERPKDRELFNLLRKKQTV